MGGDRQGCSRQVRACKESCRVCKKDTREISARDVDLFCHKEDDLATDNAGKSDFLVVILGSKV